MRVSYCDGYSVTLPAGHPFPISKFTALHGILLGEGVIQRDDVAPPEQADWGDLARVHTPDYLDKLRLGCLDGRELRRLGLPWSEALVRRSRYAVQGTINASLFALQDGIGANLAGGTHHSFADRGEGFCLLNDVAVAIRSLRARGLFQRVLVIDLDVHQGNGTADIFAQDPEVHTFSIHGAKNYPFHKATSCFDLGLPDGADDADYLQRLAETLPQAFDASRPQIVFYLAGVDPRRGDRFGRLALTRRGLHERDRIVLQATWKRGIPVVLLLSGGYARTPQETAGLHAITHREARSVYG